MFDVTQLTTAISALETAEQALVAADGNQQRAQEKYDAALTAKTAADGDDAAAVTAFNASLDGLIEACQAAKVDRSKEVIPIPQP